MQKRHNSIANALALCLFLLTPKQLELHWCILSTGATDTLVLKDQIISTHNADKMIIAFVQFHAKYCEQHQKMKLHWAKISLVG